MISLVQSGMGVALVAGVTRYNPANNIKFLRIKGSEQSNRIGLALALPRGQRSRVTEKFLEFALRQVPSDTSPA